MNEETHASIIVFKHNEKEKTIFEGNSTKNKSENQQTIPNVALIQNSKNQNQQTNSNANKPGFFSNMWNNMSNMWGKIKNYWVTEEEEYIDAHGFKAKRPKNKIPLRKQKDAIQSETRFQGGEALTYASQHSPFGRMFL